MIQKAIADLVGYGLAAGLIETEDALYSANKILEVLQLEELEESAETAIQEYETMTQEEREGLIPRLEETLAHILDYAYGAGLIEDNTVTRRDLFDTKIMGLLTDRPSHIAEQFLQLYRESPEKATDWFYKFSQDTDYIRRYRICKDEKWVTATAYGDLDITINLSKPEKDPKAIAAAGKAKASGYPKCLLCRENAGYAGRMNHPARQNHRPIPITIAGGSWFLQYSPYVYYNEHCIVFNGQHQPMKIDRSAFAKLFDFVTVFPHYFVGSNADLPIVGGSILSHEHFQGGHYEFAMAKAPTDREVSFAGFEDVKAGIVRWPMSVIRITGPDRDRLLDLADKILGCWRGYTDEEAFIFAETEGTPHNTITPIARRRGEDYEMDLVLRNNMTTDEHPLGVYHPHADLHHIKKENIGLIELMGLAVLPARLKGEMASLRQAVLEGRDLRQDPVLEKHADWADEWMKKYERVDESTIDQIIHDEIGFVFARVLEDAGVYKRDEQGQQYFMRFIDYVNTESRS